VEDVCLSFGGVKVLDHVSFDVQPGSITSLIGPNGAGKSSLVNVITRVYQPQLGSVTLGEGASAKGLQALPPHALAHHGVSRTFQNLQLVPQLTALDNVLVGRHRHMKAGPFAVMSGMPRARREEARHRDICLETMRFLELAEIAGRPVASLPYGVQKRVELARALVARPRLLLLDEPAAGLNDEETAELADVMRLVRDSGTCTQLVIEHDMNLVMGVSDHIVVLNFGTVLATGGVEEIRNHPEVVTAYLGSPAA
jgi:branched-chain amino acid transport system ATP-binding protein